VHPVGPGGRFGSKGGNARINEPVGARDSHER
jgi:hypothetical protein